MKLISRFVLPLSVLFLTACAGPTQLVSQWQNQRCLNCTPLKSTLVVVGTKNVVARRIVEDQWVKQLALHNVQAYPSYLYLPNPTQISSDDFIALSKKLHSDNILMTKVTQVTPATIYQTQPDPWLWNNSFPHYYGNRLWAPAYEFPPTIYIAPQIYAETTVYNIKAQEFSWMVNTKTIAGSYSVQELAAQMTELVAAAMTQDRVLPPRKADSLALGN
ncbi:MAG: hypothetical protein ACRDDD_10720 [Plesiomonas sp.]|uniref:hypothetical protein n=1 Tax=Plesiomonas sp. TaxID=2486279 RepID=UPI003EE81750